MIDGEPLWISCTPGTDITVPPGCAAILVDGGVEAPTRTTAELPVGLHSLVGADGIALGWLAVTPARLESPSRSWAWSVFPLTLRTGASWGTGDFQDLRAFCDWSGNNGAGYVFLGPTNAGYVTLPVHPSPYSPSSRLFHQILLLHPPAIPGWQDLSPEYKAVSDRADALNAREYMDLDAALELKMPVLRELFRLTTPRLSARDRDSLAAFQAELGPELRLFALYCAIESEYGQDWRNWPTAMRNPRDALACSWSRQNEELIDFFAWCQWQLDQQLASAAAAGPGLVRDLPVGTPMNAADAWMWQECLAPDWRLGAPADYFSPSGHHWDLVPYDPKALAAAGFRPFQLAVRAALRHAAGIRVDHALGLIRQFWLPVGGAGDRGHYVAQPTAALADIICIEAYRHRAFVVTEELGNAPIDGLGTFRQRGFLSYDPVIADGFEMRPRGGVVAPSTHDLPTVAGCWTGADTEALTAAGIPVDAGFAERARARLTECAQLPAGAAPGQIIAEVYRWLAASDACLVVVSPEDALGCMTRPNVPGTSDSQWPNFRRRLPPFAALAASPGARVLTAIARRDSQ